jgi:hypothetical protein
MCHIRKVYFVICLGCRTPLVVLENKPTDEQLRKTECRICEGAAPPTMTYTVEAEEVEYY